MMFLDIDGDIYWKGVRLNCSLTGVWKGLEYWGRFEHSRYTSVLLPKEYMK